MSSLPLQGSDDRPVIWCFDPRPGSLHITAMVGPLEYDTIMGQGFASLDGMRAHVVVSECDPATGWMRFWLEQPYEYPAARKEFAAEPSLP